LEKGIKKIRNASQASLWAKVVRKDRLSDRTRGASPTVGEHKKRSEGKNEKETFS